MTLYEKILTFSVEDMAEFVTELIGSVELRFLEDMQQQGYGASIVRPARAINVANNLATLLQEVDDEYT